MWLAILDQADLGYLAWVAAKVLPDVVRVCRPRWLGM